MAQNAFSCVQGSFLEDVQRLHIPTLVWGPPPAVSGRPSRALRRIAGHTFAGLLAFGGCIPTIMGIMPVEKLDLLLLGNHWNVLAAPSPRNDCPRTKRLPTDQALILSVCMQGVARPASYL